MRKRTFLIGASVSLLVALGAASLVLANDPPADGSVEELSGSLTIETDADGDVTYSLDGVELSVGPPWFWGDNHPLDGFANGDQITVTGGHDDGTPNENANPRAGGGGPSFDVLTVNGTEVRAQGKPPWAGGPKAVGESHPGWEGWQKAHEMSGGRAGGPATDDVDDAE